MRRRRMFLLAVIAAWAPAWGCGGDVITAQPDSSTPLPQERGRFPAGFLWGTTIAPYLVEGGLHDTDWHQWESRCGESCAGQSADDGPGFLAHHADDLSNAAAISNNAIRLGIDWSRLFPSRQAFDARTPDPGALATYRDVIDAARARGLAVMVTLVHGVLPVWIHDIDDPQVSGWEDDRIIDDVAGFAGWAAGEFGADVDYWITLSEPVEHVLGGWIHGDMPPGKTLDVDGALAVLERMIRAHARAYDAIEASDLADSDGDGSATHISIAKRNRVLLPTDPRNPADQRAADMLVYLLNHAFLQAVVFGNLDRDHDHDLDGPLDIFDDDSLKGRLDFIGLNYDGVALVARTPSEATFPFIGLINARDLINQGMQGPISDVGRTIYPQGIGLVLDELLIYGRPIIITGNGVADATGNLGPRFLLDHLYAINQAIDDGIDIRGYFHYTLFDSFHWSSGLCPRFGLFRVDHDSPDKPRTITPAAELYRDIIDANTVEPGWFAEYPGYGDPGFCRRAPR